MEQTTIKISKKIRADLEKQKNHPKETYQEVIDRLLRYYKEDDDYLSPEIIKNIEDGIADIKAGRTYTDEQMIKKLGI